MNLLYDYLFANSIYTFFLCKYKKIVHDMVILIRSNPLYTMHVCNMCRNHMYINVMQLYVGQGQSLKKVHTRLGTTRALSV
jgi:hypothetical protein